MMKSSSKGFLGQRVAKPASPENLSTFDAGIASQMKSESKTGNHNSVPQIELKQVSRAIHLEKEMLIDEVTKERYYMFRLISKTLKIIEFTADFTGSTNCQFIDLQKCNIFGSQQREYASEQDR